jgi:hypothetical protein
MFKHKQEFAIKIEVMLMKWGKQLKIPVRDKDGNYIMLNLLRESQGCINSFKSLSENMKH